MKGLEFPRGAVRLAAAGIIATTMAISVATSAFADLKTITLDNFSNDMVSTFTCGSGGTVSGDLNFDSGYVGTVQVALFGKQMTGEKFANTGQTLSVPVNLTSAGSVAFSFTNATTFNSNTGVQDTIFRVDVLGSTPPLAGAMAGETKGPSFQCTSGGTTTTTTGTTTTGTTTTGTTTMPGGGPPPPNNTPELGSGELVATGLLPLVGILMYRRTRRRR